MCFVVDVSKSIVAGADGAHSSRAARLDRPIGRSRSGGARHLWRHRQRGQRLSRHACLAQRRIDALTPSDATTQLHAALARALELGRRADTDLPTRRAIVVLSDGRDEGSGLTEDDLAARIREDRLPIYAIGYPSGRDARARQGLASLNRFSVNSGGVFREAGGGDVAPLYADMHRAIGRVFVTSLTCDACVGDGNLHRVQVKLAGGGGTLSSGIELRLPATPASQAPRRHTPERTAPRLQPVPWWAWLAAAVALATIVALGLLLWLRRRSRTTAMQSIDPEATVADIPTTLRARVTFHFRDGASRPRAFDLDTPVTLGADAGCTLQLADDADVSPAHSELFLDDGRVVVRPLDTRATDARQRRPGALADSCSRAATCCSSAAPRCASPVGGASPMKMRPATRSIRARATRSRTPSRSPISTIAGYVLARRRARRRRRRHGRACARRRRRRSGGEGVSRALPGEAARRVDYRLRSAPRSIRPTARWSISRRPPASRVTSGPRSPRRWFTMAGCTGCRSATAASICIAAAGWRR